MKTLFILIGFLPMIASAQDTISPRITCKKIALDQIDNSLTTMNEKGEPMAIISAMEVEINSRRCSDKGLKVSHTIENKKEFLNPAFYRWDPAGGFWIKCEQNGKYLNASKKTVLTSTVKCPGVYAFMYKPLSNEKGIVFECSKKVVITSILVEQHEPTFRMLKEYKNEQKEVVLPTADLHFHASITVSYLKNGIKYKQQFMAGSLTDFEDEPNEKGYRIIKFNPDENKSMTVNNKP